VGETRLKRGGWSTWARDAGVGRGRQERRRRRDRLRQRAGHDDERPACVDRKYDGVRARRDAGKVYEAERHSAERERLVVRQRSRPLVVAERRAEERRGEERRGGVGEGGRCDKRPQMAAAPGLATRTRNVSAAGGQQHASSTAAVAKANWPAGVWRDEGVRDGGTRRSGSLRG
jgi:hypothetical protein